MSDTGATYSTAWMPPRAELPMAQQDFRRAPQRRPRSWQHGWRNRAWRVAAFAPAIATTLLLSLAIARWLAEGGVTAIEAVLVVLVALTFVWVSLSVSVVICGLIRYAWNGPTAPREAGRRVPQRVALLMPIYNEVPSDVFGNAAAMLSDLEDGAGRDRFDFFILSDTRAPETAAQEERAFTTLRDSFTSEIYYRRRVENTDKKVGNITDWIEGYGAAYDAMLVLDADSLMSGAAIEQLADELAHDPSAGLIQSFPTLIRAETLFGRMQQFANSVYGWLLAEGLAAWSQREGNYWGHNAIIRVESFAASARLPYLRRRGGGEELILSHDFVEAGLLRRAGWGVRFLPQVEGSYEETPPTLIDYALRDRRWCQGNLQHLRLLTARGFHPVSRFHLLQGAVGFLLSPAWFLLIIIWPMVGSIPEEHAYFSPSNPIYPNWTQTSEVSGIIYLVFIYGMLLLPKLLAALALGLRCETRAAYGGWGRFVATAVFEIGCSILYAPILMVQQTIAVLRASFRRSGGWTPQNRGGGRYTWRQTWRFHLVETLLGAVLAVGIAAGMISLWLLPIAISLLAATLLSQLSGLRVCEGRVHFARLEAPLSLREPAIIAQARQRQAWLKHRLSADEQAPIAAE